jgi:hypothetical protein
MKLIEFVDEILAKIGGLEYWTWLAYEPKTSVCWIMIHLIGEKDNFRKLSILQAVKTRA